MHITMKKIVLGVVAAAAVAAPLALATAANADTATPVGCSVIPVHGTKTTETFSVLNPRGAFSQWDNVWEHDYTVVVNADGTFTGTGYEYNREAGKDAGYVDETISGKFGTTPDGLTTTVTFTANQLAGGQNSYTLTDIPANGDAVQNAVTNPFSPYGPVESRVTTPQVVGVPQDVVTGYRLPLNHGEYVTYMGGGKTAAQSPCGMPVQANK